MAMNPYIARDNIEKHCPIGSTVYMVVRHVSRSKYNKVVSCFVIYENTLVVLDTFIVWAMPYTYCPEKGGIKIYGMDDERDLVRDISARIYGRYDYLKCVIL